MQLPIDPRQAKIASGYGWRRLDGRADYHTGVDFAARPGTPVLAAGDGTLVRVYEPGELRNYGRTIVIRHTHTPPLLTLYAHLQSAIDATPGTTIMQGEVIGTVGRTAGTREDPSREFATSGAHLHFETLAQWPAKPDEHRYDPFTALGVLVPTDNRPGFPAVAPAAAGGLLAVGLLYWYLKDRRRTRSNEFGA